MNRIIFLITFILCFSAAACASQKDIVITDFEGANYGSWQVGGNAFGQRPASGTLEDQQDVSGFQGKGLVNTFLGSKDKQTLFITARTSLYSVRMRVKGI